MSEQDDILAANAAYYEAFASADFGKMSHIWADDEVTCVHPGWPVLIGRPAILKSYRNILSNPNQDRIEPHNAIAMVRGDEGRVICVELIGGNALALAATNWFRTRRWCLADDPPSSEPYRCGGRGDSLAATGPEVELGACIPLLKGST